MCEVLDRVENQGRREGRKEGRKEGRREGLQIGIKEFIGICRRFNMSDEEICLEIKGRFQITKAQAERFVKGIY